MKPYKTILEACDVAVWIIKTEDKILDIDRYFTQSVLPQRLRNRLIIGINKIDLAEPQKWSKEFNLPSREQEEDIRRKEVLVNKIFIDVGVTPFAIVSYSAKNNFRLTKLFRTMVDACPSERVAALVKRGDIRSFLSPELQDAYNIS